ncbi:MAG: 16S rRNA (guanine(966)-N(2))-methyltransferase RsmD [Nitrospirae bacterium]|nr:16S rRNA (guanine(966)-N(2))-methyltransferase RsmD [Nitrospirota bacterium]MCL5423169.1 16S rRNA (guanine(966)-N(2))-methyltransferase RsmD [Nitrospirota bacterium]
MRISGGSAKGRKIGFKKAFLKKDEGDVLRPTSAKVREALFDIIRKELPGSVFLDLYAGTGGVGIEALSRGAAKAVMVEANKLRVRMIHHLLSEFNFSDRARVANLKAFDFAGKEGEKGQRYDIIFLDPPYGSEELTKMLPLIGEGKIIREGGLVIAEHFFKTKLPESVGKLKFVKGYKYGDTVLTLYKSCYDL